MRYAERFTRWFRAAPPRLRDARTRLAPRLRDARTRLAPTLHSLWLRPRRRLATAGVLVLLVAGLVWALWPAPQPPEPPRARQYLAYTACLLTDDHGTQGPAAAPVWAGMQDASLATRAKVQFLVVTGPQTAENAAPFVASLAQSHCDLVFAAGRAPSAGVRRSAPTFPRVRFFLVGDPNPGGNISSVDGRTPELVRASVAGILERSARGQR